jgi:hypothetical protein
MNRVLLLTAMLFAFNSYAQDKSWQGKFEQLGSTLPTPNEYRTGSGAPGPKYWQQKADYVIDVELDDTKQIITGKETITYHNNAPESLTYLWLQLDQNIIAQDNLTKQTSTTSIRDSVNTRSIAGSLGLYDFDGGYKIKSVKDVSGKDLPYTVNYTMMRIDLPKPLKNGEKFSFNVEWWYNIGDRMKDGERSGLEYFPEDDNYVYTIAHWFPRMCVYDDVEGWQNKQFLGRGEFALPFGDYKVRITVPADHIVASTGWLQNPKDVLTATEQQRYEQAKKSFDKPVIIVTEAEAKQKEKTKSTGKRTWEYHAENVRDFAFASSRKFIWDAQAVKVGDKTPLAMSYYPKEGNPLWEKESTKAVKNTLITYSKHTIDYPYPVAISVHAASIGMEYPMICFNFGRPNKDGSYSDRVKWGMIGVIIHEVGHNFFPMIINNDEREMTWMDEGVNSFVQHLTQVEHYKDFPHRRGPAANLVPYMKGDRTTMRPLMTGSDNVIQFGAEQYGKGATALNILRETVMGPELFDKAFKEYSERWAFKHPKPADFFRTMEDASGVDLDWFWKGWFYTTDVVDQSVEKVRWFKLREGQTDPERRVQAGAQKDLGASKSNTYTDFSQGPEPFSVIDTDPRFYGEFQNRVDDKAIKAKLAGKNIYEVTFKNNGGLVMPVIVEFKYKDGTSEIERIPAEIWRTNEQEATKVFVKDKEVVQIVLDPKLETTDINTSDNVFPRQPAQNRFDEMRRGRN